MSDRLIKSRHYARLRRLAIRGSEWAGARVAHFPEHRERLSEQIGPAHQVVNPYTMTSIERQFALHEAVKYVVQAEIPGDIVECGVWRGGSAMLCALTLQELGDLSRNIVLYDTFAGMSAPTEKDKDPTGLSALAKWRESRQDGRNDWCFASLEDVQSNLRGTGYPEDRVIYIQGKVEDTIPERIPETIALLRLDTDWYESTYHEMVHLFPRLAVGGVLLLDDYGHWQGAREAVDRYLAEQGISLLLARVDYTARVAVKTELSRPNI